MRERAPQRAKPPPLHQPLARSVLRSKKSVAPLKIKISTKKKSKKKKNSSVSGGGGWRPSEAKRPLVFFVCFCFGLFTLHADFLPHCTVISQDEEDVGNNTSDEEFERQLEEAALIQQQEKEEKARKPKVKQGRGRKGKKKSSSHFKRTSTFPADLDAEGYEVVCVKFCTFTLPASRLVAVYCMVSSSGFSTTLATCVVGIR